MLSLSFATGHVLALRRFTASSVGQAYTAVWHRSPEDRWTFYPDAPPSRSCPRYFDGGTARSVRTSIHLAWSTDRALVVSIADIARLDWKITLDSTPTTRLLNTMAGIIPEELWHRQRFLTLMGHLAGRALGAGRIRLHGSTPNHQWFLMSPLPIWTVKSSQTSLDGRDLGPPAPLDRQTHLADFWLPQRGLVAVGHAFFEPLDVARHICTPGKAESETEVPVRSNPLPDRT